MYSYPNLIPLDGATVRRIVATLERYDYSKLYGAWPGFVVSGDPKLALRRSAERYFARHWRLQAARERAPHPARSARVKKEQIGGANVGKASRLICFALSYPKTRRDRVLSGQFQNR